jgi:hypothetical protein
MDRSRGQTRQIQECAMSASNKSKNTSTASADSLTKAASVELSEAALGEASGGAVFPSSPQFSALKVDSTLKSDLKIGDINTLLPAVQKP